MAALTLNEIKRYIHADDLQDSAAQALEDADIQALWDAAKGFLTGAGVGAGHAGTPRYNLAVKALVLHWYDNRGDIITGTIVSDIPMGLEALITQLQWNDPPVAEPEEPVTE